MTALFENLRYSFFSRIWDRRYVIHAVSVGRLENLRIRLSGIFLDDLFCHRLIRHHSLHSFRVTSKKAQNIVMVSLNVGSSRDDRRLWERDSGRGHVDQFLCAALARAKVGGEQGVASP